MTISKQRTKVRHDKIETDDLNGLFDQSFQLPSERAAAEGCPTKWFQVLVGFRVRGRLR
jgi:hypothetical protein